MSEILCDCCNAEGDHPSRIICDACFQSAKGKADCCIATQAENKRLKKALKEYGRCWSGCDSRAVLVESEGKGKGWYAAYCTCGFDKALKGK